MHDTHVEHCIYLPAQRKKIQVKTTTINGNVPALQHTITYKKKWNLIQKQPTCKKKYAAPSVIMLLIIDYIIQDRYMGNNIQSYIKSYY